jgi:hypothetical protein
MKKKPPINRVPTFKDLPSPAIAKNVGTAKGSDVDESGFYTQIREKNLSAYVYISIIS